MTYIKTEFEINKQKNNACLQFCLNLRNYIGLGSYRSWILSEWELFLENIKCALKYALFI